MTMVSDSDLLLLAMAFGCEEIFDLSKKSSTQNQEISTRIPIIGSENLEVLGFKLGENIDSVFRIAEWPEGWKVKSTPSSMWSDIIDNKQQRRASIFYKNLFSYQEAYIRLNPRFVLKIEPISYNTYDFDSKEWLPCILDNANGNIRRYILCDPMTHNEASDQLYGWMNLHRPYWRNEIDYWNDTSADLPEELLNVT